ncbi:MAG: DUF2804 family protein [Myxococcales bacterium]|nr:DUF2804 family protein [Myxococcales bacterium]
MREGPHGGGGAGRGGARPGGGGGGRGGGGGAGGGGAGGGGGRGGGGGGGGGGGRRSSTAEVELEFRPLGARRQRLELGILRSNFVQAYGTFHGTVTPAGLASAEVDGVFGVVENHDALW